uniref:Uncharacterized protein n=1 Tax=Anguilla anguilla TaxID=7936 RepID=A0A0E9T585_ANGAN
MQKDKTRYRQIKKTNFTVTKVGPLIS